jgi:hypothetical protein
MRNTQKSVRTNGGDKTHYHSTTQNTALAGFVVRVCCVLV